MKPFLRLFVLLVLALGMAVSVARAEEFIQSYHAEIAVADDGELTVTESIRVRAEGNRIQRGIFRDFPLTQLGPDGRTRQVDFDVVSVERDGASEPWFTENVTGGLRIYTGSKDVYLPTGSHLYRITYKTGRQIRYFKDYDELMWNVTGNGWQFRMAEITATVTLPEGVRAEDTAVYTGRLGDKGRDARAFIEGNRVRFATTRAFGAGEGLTIDLKLPKGAIAAPSATQERWWWFRDNRDTLIGFGGLLVVFLYYFRAWVAVGRDPAAGVMVPRWDAPEGISPALVNYIDNKGFSGQGWTALSASALDLAVKGYVTLEDLKRSIVIRRTDKALPARLPEGQAALVSAIGEGGELVIDKAHGEQVERVGKAFRNAIEKEHRGKYYQSNALYIVGGVLLSLAALFGLLVFGGLNEDAVALLIVPVIAAIVIGVIAVKIGKGFRAGASLISRIGAIISLGFTGLVAVSIFGTIFATILTETTDHGAMVTLVAGGGIALVNTLFFFLMGAPTPLGRKLMDGIEGLRTYLTLAEKDRMNMAGAPEMSPSHFEKLLPYAVALGVEKPWTRTFETWLATAAAGAAAANYQPGWYNGNAGSFSDRIGGFSSTMASTIASTIPQPVSSSGSGFSGGGGGGFSGGGGGGGGGGGW